MSSDQPWESSVSVLLRELAQANDEADQFDESVAPDGPSAGTVVVERAAVVRRLDGRRQALLTQLPFRLVERHRLLQEEGCLPYICDAKGGRCTVCNLELPTILAEALSLGGGELCPNCGRLLYCDLSTDGPSPSRTASGPEAL